MTAFSNHTEFEMWEVNWCDRCLRDAPFRRMDKGFGCPILARALLGEQPAEWLQQPDDHYPSDAYHCIEFRAPGGGGSGEPKPIPDPPAQDGMFPRPDPAVRMLVPTEPERTLVSA